MTPLTSTDVYIVDDDLGVRTSTWFMLSEAGLKPRVFAEGADFLSAWPTLPHGVVLLDLQMPGMNGFEILQTIRPEKNRLPVIVVTGFGDVSGAVRAMKLGAVDFIQKPYVDHELIALIEAAVIEHKKSSQGDEQRESAQRALNLLSPREQEVLQLMVVGLPNKLIAYRLQISGRTVEMHRAKVMSRLGLSSLSAVVRLAMLAGLETASS